MMYKWFILASVAEEQWGHLRFPHITLLGVPNLRAAVNLTTYSMFPGELYKDAALVRFCP